MAFDFEQEQPPLIDELRIPRSIVRFDDGLHRDGLRRGHLRPLRQEFRETYTGALALCIVYCLITLDLFTL